jgi:hypothetical protein
MSYYQYQPLRSLHGDLLQPANLHPDVHGDMGRLFLRCSCRARICTDLFACIGEGRDNNKQQENEDCSYHDFNLEMVLHVQ